MLQLNKIKNNRQLAISSFQKNWWNKELACPSMYMQIHIALNYSHKFKKDALMGGFYFTNESKISSKYFSKNKKYIILRG